MNLGELKLKKEELPILHESCFEIPIHPTLLNDDLTLPHYLASETFRETIDDWYEDLRNYVNKENLKPTKRKWYENSWLKEKPKIERHGTHQVLIPSQWIDKHITQENGFARCFSISRDFGGSLYFPSSYGECETILSLSEENNGYIRFSSEKTKEFGFKEINYDNRKMVNIHIYGHHNIDHFHGALFLRNWAINYMNKAFEFIAD